MSNTARPNQNSSIEFEIVDPWDDPVDPVKLLNQISDTIRRFIICDIETSHAATLWVTMTWLMDVVHVAPLAVITAPEKRCGKTMMLTLLGKIVCRPLTASNITPAALFRTIDACQPTLLIDEADAFMKEYEELRGVINCGHTRDSAYIIRLVGKNHTPTMFNVWGAKAIAGIGRVADTIMDRSITLELRRKLPGERVDRLRHSEPGHFPELVSKLARFANDYREAISKSRPELPEQLNDRAQDNWEPLFTIAEIAGGVWPSWARKAAIKLSGHDDSSHTIGTELLADIREVFEETGLDRISSADLIKKLCEDEEKPWATYNRGLPIKPRQISTRLKQYGVTSKTIRLGYGQTPKGYMLDQFTDAFARYLDTSEESATTPQDPFDVGLAVADGGACCATEKASATYKPGIHAGCGGVADNNDQPNDGVIRVNQATLKNAGWLR